MKKSSFFVIFFVVVATINTMISSCEKNETPKQNISRIEEFRNVIAQNPEKYARPSDDFILSEYEKRHPDSLGFKSITVDAIVNYGDNLRNSFIETPDGGFIILYVWTISKPKFNEPTELELVAEGFILLVVDQNYNPINYWEYRDGWNHPDLAIEVTIKNTINSDTTKINLCYPVTMGNMDFEETIIGQNDLKIWLPQLDFTFGYTTKTPTGNSFGGTGFFNPADDAEIFLLINLFEENATDIIKVYPNSLPVGVWETIFKINIYDENNIWIEERIFPFPENQIIPDSILFPLTYTPKMVKWYTVSFPIESVSDTYEETLVLSNSNGGIRYWVFQ